MKAQYTFVNDDIKQRLIAYRRDFHRYPELVKCGYDAANRLGLGDMFESNAVFNASEDVVTMMNHVQNQGGKAAYFMFGTELIAEHHHSRFDFNEEVLPLMVEFYSKLLVKKPNKPYHSFGL